MVANYAGRLARRPHECDEARWGKKVRRRRAHGNSQNLKNQKARNRQPRTRTSCQLRNLIKSGILTNPKSREIWNLDKSEIFTNPKSSQIRHLAKSEILANPKSWEIIKRNPSNWYYSALLGPRDPSNELPTQSGKCVRVINGPLLRIYYYLYRGPTWG